MRLGRLLAITFLLAGLVGFTSPSTVGAGPTAPEPKESIKATVKRLKQALKSGSCQSLGKVLRHSSSRVDPDVPTQPVKPKTKFSTTECEQIETFAATLEGFKPTKQKAFGTGAIVEGAKDDLSFVVTFALDVDGKFRAVGAGQLEPQIGTETDLDLDASITAWLAAVAAGDCNETWRLFTVDSVYVTARFPGGVTQWCTDFSAALGAATGRLFDLSQAAGATPTQLAALKDVGIYGIALPSGRYVTIILFSEPGAVEDHANPGVFEFVSSRLPDTTA
jgi:hypothetical protein